MIGRLGENMPKKSKSTVNKKTQKPQMQAEKKSRSNNDDWISPPKLVEAAREFLGDFDLDPASSLKGQEIIKADAWCGLDHPDPAFRDGLSLCWSDYACLWINPPYSFPLIEKFTQKALDEAARCLFLTNASLDTAWAHKLLKDAVAVCFTRGRLSFLDRNLCTVNGNRVGQALWYIRSIESIGKNFKEFSDSVDEFKTVFGSFGTIVELGELPKSKRSS